MKVLASVALLSTLASACALPRSASHVVVGTGVVVSVLGVSAIADAQSTDLDNNGVNDTELDDGLGLPQLMGGSLLFLAGAALVVAGLTSHQPEDAHLAPATPPRRPASVTWTPEVQPFLYAESEAPGASLPPPLMPAHAALPEVATTDVVLRMAQQARAAIERGHCDAAWSTWDAMNLRDARYASALAAGPVFAPCPRATAINVER